MDDAALLCSGFRDEANGAGALYEVRLAAGMARELARINLPLSTYTEWVWKIDLHNLLGFLALRLDSHAQYEIRVYAEAIAQLVQPRVPLTWEAFEDFRLGAVTLSKQDVEALRACVARRSAPWNWNGPEELKFKTARERDEFITKYQRLLVLEG
jgi:thymidylate synthase (FAD)